MRLSKWGYYADLLLYPILVPALIVVASTNHHSRYLWVFTLAALCGFAAWTFIEYATHRFVFHAIPAAARMHDLHHASPAAFVGTPVWMTLASFLFAGFIPLWALGGAEIAYGGVSGLMIGFVWYLLVHDAVHRWQLTHGSFLYNAKLRHAFHHHHSGGQEGNFGVTTGFWDRLLGTEIEPVARRVRADLAA
jgi:sterol desaturase/sphingolipid hydroxylase (fatty acid hydroxylase superfamily)